MPMPRVYARTQTLASRSAMRSLRRTNTRQQRDAQIRQINPSPSHLIRGLRVAMTYV